MSKKARSSVKASENVTILAIASIVATAKRDRAEGESSRLPRWDNREKRENKDI